MIVLVLEEDTRREGELKDQLSHHGYSVVSVPDGSSLLKNLEAGNANLVILDLDFSGGDGLSLLKAAHDLRPTVPIICETAHPTVEGAVEAMRRGAYNYISKFSGIEDLLHIIDHALERERMQAEAKTRARERRIRIFDDPESVVEIDRILSSRRYSESMLISYLQDIQERLNYLPQEALRFVAARVPTSLPRVYGLATFYKAFSLVPRGRHLIQVCLGTACHVRGGASLLESFERELGIRAGETTYDNRFSLESVRCVGCCGLAPVFIIDGKFYGKMTQDKVPQVLGQYD